MNELQFFPNRPAAAPNIYAFASTHQDYAGLLKVGYTERMAGEHHRTADNPLESV